MSNPRILSKPALALAMAGAGIASLIAVLPVRPAAPPVPPPAASTAPAAPIGAATEAAAHAPSVKVAAPAAAAAPARHLARTPAMAETYDPGFYREADVTPEALVEQQAEMAMEAARGTDSDTSADLDRDPEAN